jgi:5-formyltetrahydrofolate cyclo-ligase
MVGEQLEFFKPSSDEDFQVGSLGILEPIVEKSQALDPKIPMVVLTPAVAVDRKGGRLGMGKGFYDRFFTRFPQALRVGVVFQIQVADEILPRDAWDLPLDWIISEQMILRTSNRSH